MKKILLLSLGCFLITNVIYGESSKTRQSNQQRGRGDSYSQPGGSLRPNMRIPPDAEGPVSR